jgi:hypothetical protein
VVDKLTPEVKARMDEIAPCSPQVPHLDQLATFRGRWL